MIQVYIGEGKGKTTASIGLSIRAAGHGFNVLFMQFLKDDSSGEISVLRSISGIEVIHCPVNYGFTFQMTEDQKKETALEYDKMLDKAIEADVFLIVLDEAIHALNAGLINQEKLERLLHKNCEIVLTGRNAPEWLTDRADYVSDIQKIKHPYDKRVQARVGIEF
jgi:cob(I)alamin adenosyltransferase